MCFSTQETQAVEIAHSLPPPPTPPSPPLHTRSNRSRKKRQQSLKHVITINQVISAFQVQRGNIQKLIKNHRNKREERQDEMKDVLSFNRPVCVCVCVCVCGR